MEARYKTLISMALLLLVTGSLASAGGCTDTVCTTHFDTIPRFDMHPTMASMKAGVWSDVTVWSGNRLPLATDIVQITHGLVCDSALCVADSIGILPGGKLSFAPERSTRLTVTNLQILRLEDTAVPCTPAICGELDQTASGDAQFTTEIVLRNVPLMTTVGSRVYDPKQYGNVVMVIGAIFHTSGAPKTPTWQRLGAEPRAGESMLTLTEVTNWSAGDRLKIPDTRQLTSEDLAPVADGPNGTISNRHRILSQSEVVQVASINGLIVTLTTPLQYDHLGARDLLTGQIQYLPHVGNLTRNAVIRSEDPTGVRGHVFLTGPSTWYYSQTAFQGLGRTVAAPVDETTLDPVVLCKNCKARYPIHAHHAQNPCGGASFAIVGNVVEDSGRWGMSIHGSHYGVIAENIVTGVRGAGIVTEDGSEAKNVFRHNLVMQVENDVLVPFGTEFDPVGMRGDGFWFRGPYNDVVDNVVADTREAYGWYTGASESGSAGPFVTVQFPVHSCADAMQPGQFVAQRLDSVPHGAIHNNEAYSTSEHGIGLWFTQLSHPVLTDTVLWHNFDSPIMFKYSNPRFDGLIIRNKDGVGFAVADDNLPNTSQRQQPLDIAHADIQGVDTVYGRTGQIVLRSPVHWSDSVLHSKQGIVLDAGGEISASDPATLLPRYHTFRQVRFVPMEGVPLRTLTLPGEMHGAQNNARKSVRVYQYQGVAGQNFRLWYPGQAPGLPLLFGEAAPCSDTTSHPEITGITCVLGEEDTLPPEVPVILAARAEDPYFVRLAWSLSVDNVATAGYRVWRDGVDIGGDDQGEYLDRGLAVQPGSTYRYQVVAYDHSGNVSAPSPSVTVILPLDPLLPVTPAAVRPPVIVPPVVVVPPVPVPVPPPPPPPTALHFTLTCTLVQGVVTCPPATVEEK